MENQNVPTKPNNYLVLAIICTVCCCLPAGIVSIIYAAKVNEAYARGDYEVALKASNNAKIWAFVGIGLAAIGYIIYFAIFGFAMVGGLLEGGSSF
ncbi:CD225/dispanin family protein [Muriicola sp. Z0-33]|uniref:CD225/dispanin family protein n=1 Tax=Muriicola sp. Z0-33 TaxID=2816957 RepID=UPI00223877F8|nr:CD225/dispanin family protein [Muriicola sp. Z0-33]MCW5515882.1 CD225/dispanin family protein [Muriicola sp. Z0-33]